MALKPRTRQGIIAAAVLAPLTLWINPQIFLTVVLMALLGFLAWVFTDDIF